ncbi:N-myc-interactor [Electrophorus electricus]|uniref:N-myc and STAT interactor n=1 Tax=Electrophorus electricus TaxID=8005 RepID=A0A4W4HGT6_ELEEL|nr:N-myc-interactor [Electrophorus electricus]
MSDTKHGEIDGELAMTCSQPLADAFKELEKWKKLVEAAETAKSTLLLDKLDTEETKKKAQQETTEIMSTEEQLTKSFNKKGKIIEEEIGDLDKVIQDLMKKLQQYKEQLKVKKAERDSLQQRFKIKAQIPEKRMKFTHVEKEARDETEDSVQNTKAVFTITQRPSLLLKGGQALITFEEEKVAEQILRLAKCTVSCDKDKVDVKPYAITLDPSVKFEVHVSMSKKSIEFSNAPPHISEERMRDRLELSFSKPSCGGGEVETLHYDPETGKGRVTFLNSGVAENLALKETFCADIGNGMEINVGPVYEYQLKKFQTFSGVPKRSLLLGGIQDVTDDEELQDHLEIHFQKPSNYGGEVEAIKYISTTKKLKVFFSEDSNDVAAQ